jgi:hypothetical protein
MRKPPSGVSSILSSGRRLMSISWDGVSTCNFIRSSKLVPPAMIFAPGLTAAAAAFAAESARW